METRRDGKVQVVDRDEPPRSGVTADGLAKLPPAFMEGGTVTAGSSSGINDGAAALAVVSAEAAEALGGRPLARIVATAVAGVDPSVMGIGPVPATRKALARAGLSVEQLDLVELNEAFAAQSLACVRESKLDPARVNIYGGAIALGHPLGCERGPHPRDSGACAAPDGRALRAGHDVHRGRPGHRDGGGASRAVGVYLIISPSTLPCAPPGVGSPSKRDSVGARSATVAGSPRTPGRTPGPSHSSGTS